MREIIYLTQNEIDNMIKKMKWYEPLYNSFRALQDGIIDRITTSFKIYYRKDYN